MGMSVGQKGGTMAEMNIVPLIDILLVLLIIFMAISPTISMGLDALVPQPAPPNAPQDVVTQQATIVVQVYGDGKLKINEEAATWDGLQARLDQIFKQRAQKIAFVKGDDTVYFGDVARAIDIMRAAGIDKVGLLTPRMESGQ
jgi:biopolymer transport protein TolR|nr:biopolymer transporter ExbD [Candidatus Acidoferrales bacterium]